MAASCKTVICSAFQGSTLESQTHRGRKRPPRSCSPTAHPPPPFPTKPHPSVPQTHSSEAPPGAVTHHIAGQPITAPDHLFNGFCLSVLAKADHCRTCCVHWQVALLCPWNGPLVEVLLLNSGSCASMVRHPHLHFLPWVQEELALQLAAILELCCLLFTPQTLLKPEVRMWCF